MDDERRRFIDMVGDLLSSWNLSRATGRVYGYLLVCAEPASSEQIRAALSLSTGAVSASIRELASWGLARTIPQSGSRRLLVEASGGFEQLLAANHERARAFVRTLRAGEDVVEGDHAVARLRDVTDLFEAYVDSGDRMLRERT